MTCVACLLKLGDGGDGSSGSEESGNDGGVSTMPLPATHVQTTYDVLRGLGIVGEDQASDLRALQGLVRMDKHRIK